MLLAVWYDQSDVKVAEALDDRASFRRFCGFARHEAMQEGTALSKAAVRPARANYRFKPSVHGYKAHVGADADKALLGGRRNAY
jgi:hypothetical protein